MMKLASGNITKPELTDWLEANTSMLYGNRLVQLELFISLKIRSPPLKIDPDLET